jgi:hypothetical protein
VAVAVLLATACGTSKYGIKSTAPDDFKMGQSTWIFQYTVFQRLEPGFCLVESSFSDQIIAVRAHEGFEYYPFYDKQLISGKYVMVDTYTYETVPDFRGRSFEKTVPLVIPLEEYLATRKQ